MKRRMLLAAALLAVACLPGCYDPRHDAARVLADAGYTEVSIREHSWWAFGKCGEDLYEVWFTAAGPTGRRVSGAVCSDLGKGATVRLD